MFERCRMSNSNSNFVTSLKNTVNNSDAVINNLQPQDKAEVLNTLMSTSLFTISQYALTGISQCSRCNTAELYQVLSPQVQVQVQVPKPQVRVQVQVPCFHHKYTSSMQLPM